MTTLELRVKVEDLYEVVPIGQKNECSHACYKGEEDIDESDS